MSLTISGVSESPGRPKVAELNAPHVATEPAIASAEVVKRAHHLDRAPNPRRDGGLLLIGDIPLNWIGDRRRTVLGACPEHRSVAELTRALPTASARLFETTSP